MCFHRSFIHLMSGSRTPSLRMRTHTGQCLFQSLPAVTRRQYQLQPGIKNITLYMFPLVTSPTQLSVDMGMVLFPLLFFLSRRVRDHLSSHLVFTAEGTIFKQANANENSLSFSSSVASFIIPVSSWSSHHSNLT